MEGFVEWLRNHLLTCPSKQFFHFDCPGCGLQRSILALLEGNFAESFRLYPATTPILFCFIFTALHLKFKFKYGAAIIKSGYILAALTVVISYLYKIFTHQINLVYYGK